MFASPTYHAVVIGGSWGGTEALIDILQYFDTEYRLPLIAVLHRQKNVTSHLPEILGKYLEIPVCEINEKDTIQGGILYLAPQNYHVLIEKDRSFSLDVSADIFYARPSIDALFESAAEAYGPKLVGVLLSGANSDGSEGMAAIAAAGGLTIVQDPDEAECAIMPRAALAKTKVDHIFTRHEIARFLSSIG